MKEYTDIEQSKRLVEILPLESANMYYKYVLPKSDKIMHNPVFGSPIEALEWYNKGYTHFGNEPLKLEEYCIPCWSLAALMEVMPTIDDGFEPKLYRSLDKYCCTYENEEDNSGLFRVADNCVDACYEVILKLKEYNLL